MKPDLYGEFWTAIQALRPEQRARLELVAKLDIGIARVHFGDNGTYEPDEQGESVVLLGVFDSPDIVCSNLYDIVAWRPKDDHMATRMGSAMCLGSIDPALSYDFPLRLHRTPRTWPGDWESAVIVDWDAAAATLLGDRQLVADDVAQGIEIERRLQHLRHHIVPGIPPLAVRG